MRGQNNNSAIKQTWPIIWRERTRPHFIWRQQSRVYGCLKEDVTFREWRMPLNRSNLTQNKEHLVGKFMNWSIQIRNANENTNLTILNSSNRPTPPPKKKKLSFNFYIEYSMGYGFFFISSLNKHNIKKILSVSKRKSRWRIEPTCRDKIEALQNPTNRQWSQIYPPPTRRWSQIYFFKLNKQTVRAKGGENRRW